MSTIITCTCGANVRLPEDSTQRSFRCPKCKNVFALTADSRILFSDQAKAGHVGSVCPICQAQIGRDDQVIACPDCAQAHHRECWVEVGGCSTYGCAQAPAEAKENPAQQPLTAWGDTKKCPACGETIKSIALRCRYCGTNFDTVDPLTMTDLHRQHRKAEKQQGLQGKLIALFVLSVMGFLAPLMLLVSAAYVLPKRKQLAAAGPFLLVLGYASIGLSALYTVLMVLFFLLG